MKKVKEKIFIFISISFLLAIFINGYFVDKRQFKEEINGLVLQKRTGSRGSVILLIKKNGTFDPVEYSFGGRGIYENIAIGDSISKSSKSYLLYLFRGNKQGRNLVDSIEVYHW
jgi:uncharacterized protein with NRDE domain